MDLKRTIGRAPVSATLPRRIPSEADAESRFRFDLSASLTTTVDYYVYL